MALRARGLAGEIRVWSPSPSTRSACAEASWCDRVSDSPEDACEGADLVVLCGPVDRIPPLLEKIAPFCSNGSLVTDVGSTKSAICETGARLFPSDHPASFLGSHPMAGSEKSGLSHARADLFEGRTCFLTPTGAESAGAMEQARTLWEKLGMTLIRCSPEEHDRMVARISHLPHIVASVLAATLESGPPEERLGAGSGLRDTTRVAAGDPSLWEAILLQNGSAVGEALDRFEEELRTFRNALRSDDEALRRFLEKARRYRLALDPDTQPS